MSGKKFQLGDKIGKVRCGFVVAVVFAGSFALSHSSHSSNSDHEATLFSKLVKNLDALPSQAEFDDTSYFFYGNENVPFRRSAFSSLVEEALRIRRVQGLLGTMGRALTQYENLLRVYALADEVDHSAFRKHVVVQRLSQLQDVFRKAEPLLADVGSAAVILSDIHAAVARIGLNSRMPAAVPCSVWLQDLLRD